MKSVFSLWLRTTHRSGCLFFPFFGHLFGRTHDPDGDDDGIMVLVDLVRTGRAAGLPSSEKLSLSSTILRRSTSAYARSLVKSAEIV